MAIKVAVAGAAGRMGATVCRAVDGADDMALVARADPALGHTLSDALAAGPDLDDRRPGALGVGGVVEVADEDIASVQPSDRGRHHGHPVRVDVAVGRNGAGHGPDHAQGAEEATT